MASNLKFNVVNAELELVTAAKEQGFPILFREWDRIHDLVNGMPGPERVAGHLAWASVESAIAAAIALIPWTAAYSQLDAEAHLDFAWVTPALIFLVVGSAVIAALSFWYDHSAKGEQARTAKHICDDMDALARPFRSLTPPI